MAFEYVVVKPKPARVCFGSALIRDTNPIGKGLSPFQRRYGGEINIKVTPQTYDLENVTSGVKMLEIKVQSKKGVGGLANSAAQYPYITRLRVPSPTRYDPELIYKRFKQNKVAFLRKVGRKPPIISKTPGPGIYDVKHRRCVRTRVDYNFGKPLAVPAVPEICTPFLEDVCSKCSEICADDYWNINFTTFLCHICMEEEKLWHEMYKEKELKQFTKMRTCWHKHSHEGTTAKVQLLPTNAILKKFQLENYLDLYFTPF